MRASAVLCATLLAACLDPPDSLVICHNANCVEPVDLSQDDTLSALDTSLAVRFRGRPAIDGVEVDLLWRRSASDCVFAHDLDAGTPVAPVADLSSVLVSYLESSGSRSFGDLFTLFIELKEVVTPGGDAGTLEERNALATCALALASACTAAAATENHSIEIVLSSFAPEVLHAVFTDGAYDPAYRLALVTTVPPPLDFQNARLSDLNVPISVLEGHPDWLTDAQHEAYESLGYDLSFWMYSATSEILDAIERREPRYISTGEARLLRRWLAR